MANKPPPAPWVVYAALALTQTSFGASNVILKLGLTKSNPALLGFIREGVTGLVLLLISIHTGSLCSLHISSAKRFFLPGAMLFGSHLLFIIGLKLGNEVSASIWQQGQPIYTAVIACALGWERLTRWKILGILIACSGSVFMILHEAAGQDGKTSRMQNLTSSLFLICGGVCQSSFVVSAKWIIHNDRTVSTTVLTGCSLVVTACGMLIVCFVLEFSQKALDFVAVDCPREALWVVPPSAIAPLIFWILVCFLYNAMTWASKYVQPSVVSCFVVCQPVMAAFLSQLLVSLGQNKNNSLHKPATSSLGGLGIVAGLLVVVWDEQRENNYALASQQPTVTEDEHIIEFSIPEFTLGFELGSDEDDYDYDDDGSSTGFGVSASHVLTPSQGK